jgi:hypothetical protein
VMVNQFGEGLLSQPEGITKDNSGNIYVTDSFMNQVVVFH